MRCHFQPGCCPLPPLAPIRLGACGDTGPDFFSRAAPSSSLNSSASCPAGREGRRPIGLFALWCFHWLQVCCTAKFTYDKPISQRVPHPPPTSHLEAVLYAKLQHTKFGIDTGPSTSPHGPFENGILLLATCSQEIRRRLPRLYARWGAPLSSRQQDSEHPAALGRVLIGENMTNSMAPSLGSRSSCWYPQRREYFNGGAADEVQGVHGTVSLLSSNDTTSNEYRPHYPSTDVGSSATLHGFCIFLIRPKGHAGDGGSARDLDVGFPGVLTKSS
jgi:hypothetical protein